MLSPMINIISKIHDLRGSASTRLIEVGIPHTRSIRQGDVVRAVTPIALRVSESL